MSMPSGEPQVIFDIIVLIISVAVLGLLYVTYDFCHRVNTVTPDPVNRVDSSVEPPGVTGLKPEEKQKIFKRILVGKLYIAAGVTELVDVENRRSEGAKAIPENGVVSHSVEQLDDVEMGKTFDMAVGEMASAVDDEAHLNVDGDIAAGVTELVDVENRRSEGATAIPENGAVSHSVEQLDDVKMGITFDIAVGEMASAIDDETHLKHQEQNALSCAICLSEYVDGDIVASGTSCWHLFHKSCLFEWLAKKDHCPYCRKAMATPFEMRTAAEEILGQERVNELWGIRKTIGLGHF